MSAAITIEMLNAKFEGLPVRITYSEDFQGNDYDGVCTYFRLHDENPESGIVIMEFENGLEIIFVPETLTEDSLVGHMIITKTWIRVITIGQSGCSMQQAHEETFGHERQIQICWDELGDKLAPKIPKPLEALSEAQGWSKERLLRDIELYEVAHPDYNWVLPQFLKQVAAKSSFGKHHTLVIPKSALAENGFANFNELIAGFQAMNKAWTGVIRFETSIECSPSRAEIKCFATEFDQK